MKVYLLGIYEMECDPVIGIYSTAELAKDAASEFKQNRDKWADLHIDEYELDNGFIYDKVVIPVQVEVQ